MSKLDKDDIADYKQVVEDNLGTLFMHGKMGGTMYLGLSLENLRVNIINLLEDCDDNVDDFKEAVAEIFMKLEDESKGVK